MESAQSTLSTTDVPDLIRWDASIELGIRAIDTQHRRLVDLINKLNRAMNLRKGGQAMSNVFAELIDYANTHFFDEEKLMRRYDYEGLGDQEAQHKQFVAKMKDLHDKVSSGNSMLTMDLMDFLKDWIVKHIKGTDKKYQAFLNPKA